MAETRIRLASFQIAGVPQPTGNPSSPVSTVGTLSAPASGPLTPAGGYVAGTAPTTGPVPGTSRDGRMREGLMPSAPPDVMPPTPPPRDVMPPSEPAAPAKEGAPLGLLLLFAAAIYFLAK
jgi:hypothetical protein